MQLERSESQNKMRAKIEILGLKMNSFKPNSQKIELFIMPFLFEINDNVTQFVRKPIFDPFRTNEVSFRTVYQSRDHELFENSHFDPPSLVRTGPKVSFRSV